MEALLLKLQGWKTYIVIVVGAVFNIGVAAGWWTVDSQLWELINYILGFLGIGAVRSGIKSEGKKLAKEPN